MTLDKTATIFFEEPPLKKEYSEFISVQGNISPKTLVELFSVVSLDANLRKPSLNSVVKAIIHTLENNPTKYSAYTRGLTLVASECALENQSAVVDFSDTFITKCGIIDGGHNMFAILSLLYKNAVSRSKTFKFWNELESAFEAHMHDVIEYVESMPSEKAFSIPVTLHFPCVEDSKEWADYYTELKRNVNHSTAVDSYATLHDTGYFDFIRERLPAELDARIIWKQNDDRSRVIPYEDVVSLITIPLSVYPAFINPESTSSRKRVNVAQLVYYKSKLIDKLVEFVSANDLQQKFGSQIVIENPYILSSASILTKLIELYDVVEYQFIHLYNERGLFNFRGLTDQAAFNKRHDRKILKERDGVSYFLNKKMIDVRTKEVSPSYILPILYGFSSLLYVDEQNAQICWRTDPILFWARFGQTIVSNFRDSCMRGGTSRVTRVSVGKGLSSYTNSAHFISALYERNKHVFIPATPSLPKRELVADGLGTSLVSKSQNGYVLALSRHAQTSFEMCFKDSQKSFKGSTLVFKDGEIYIYSNADAQTLNALLTHRREKISRVASTSDGQKSGFAVWIRVAQDLEQLQAALSNISF